MKQTYSALVSLPSSSNPRGPPNVRKWHLTAYLEQNTLPDLLTIDTDPALCDIQLPQGMYRSGKSRQRQNNPDGSGGLRWINMDGTSGQSSPRQTSRSSPDASSSSSPSQSPTISNSPSLIASPPISPTIAQSHARRPIASQASSRPSVAAAYLDSSTQGTLLPPFSTAFALPPSPPPSRPGLQRRSSDNRTPEDARVIGLLNSRNSLA